MLKKIRVDEARVGMYVKKLEGSWLDHSFWKSSFELSGDDILVKLRDSGVQEVWIDTRRGLDVVPREENVAGALADAISTANPSADDSSQSDFDADAGLLVQDSAGGQLPTQTSGTQPRSRPLGQSRRLADEVVQAAQVIEKGKHVVADMLGEARLGNLSVSAARVLVEEITDSVSRNADAFISVARLKTRDEYTYLHSVAVCALMVALARQLGCPEDIVRLAGFAGLMHDIGKVAIPDDILNKPSALTDEEFRIIKSHPEAGAKLLALSPEMPPEVIDVCLHHHERLDGKGYPHGLQGEALSLLARMGAVCDVYDAVTSDRPYKRAWPASEAIKRMSRWAGAHLDMRLFQAFVKAVGIYPVGTLVRLSNDKLAIVVGQTGKSLLTPDVLVFYSITGGARIIPETYELASRPETIVSVEDPAQWGLDNLEALWSGTGR